MEKFFLPFSHDHIYNSSFYLDTLVFTHFYSHFYFVCVFEWVGEWVPLFWCGGWRTTWKNSIFFNSVSLQYQTQVDRLGD